MANISKKLLGACALLSLALNACVPGCGWTDKCDQKGDCMLDDNSCGITKVKLVGIEYETQCCQKASDGSASDRCVVMSPVESVDEE